MFKIFVYLKFIKEDLVHMQNNENRRTMIGSYKIKIQLKAGGGLKWGGGLSTYS